MEATTIGAEMLLTLSGTRKNTLEASNFVSLVESFYFVFIYLFFFCLLLLLHLSYILVGKMSSLRLLLW